jgi:uncharacterized protein (UPF0335 family)
MWPMKQIKKFFNRIEELEQHTQELYEHINYVEKKLDKINIDNHCEPLFLQEKEKEE